MSKQNSKLKSREAIRLTARVTKRTAAYKQQLKEKTGVNARRLPDFENPNALLNPGEDLRQLRHEPEPQGLVGSVADAQPNNDRTDVGLLRPDGEVFVLGDDDHARGQRVVPNLGVVSFAQAHFPDGLGVVSGLAQPESQRGRQLGVNEELHRVATRTG